MCFWVRTVCNIHSSIGELWCQTYITTPFRYDILCILTLIVWKLQVVYGTSTYQMTALLLEMPIFWVRRACEIQLVRYGSKHASQSLSDKPFCILTCVTWRLQVVYEHSAYQTTALVLSTFPCVVYSCMRPHWRATAPDMHRSFSGTTLCGYTANAYIHCYLVCNYARQQNSRTSWQHTTHQMTASLCFIRTKLASYTKHCSAFSINHAN